MIERKFCQLIDKNPNLIKTLNKMPVPYREHIMDVNWGIGYIYHGDVKHSILPDNWIDPEPNTIN